MPETSTATGFETTATMDRSDRRGGPRVEVLGSLHGQLVPLRVMVRVREIGFGGFSIESDVPLPIDVQQDFRFTLRQGNAVTIRARVVHCRGEQRDDRPVYVVGLAFADELPGRRRRTRTKARLADPALAS